MSRPDVFVLYHGQCRDGFCAAWVAYNNLQVACNPVLVPLVHGAVDFPALLERVRGHEVWMLDFCLPPEQMDRLAQVCELELLDHHVTARDAMTAWFTERYGRLPEWATFDLERSGARLSFDRFFPGNQPSLLIQYVEDRDLWRHQLTCSHEVNAYLSTLPYQLDAWTEASSVPLAELVARGRIALAKTRHYVQEVAANAQHVWFAGLVCQMVNAPQVDISELLDELLERGSPIAIGWWQRADGRYSFSLRSRRGEGVDVSVLAAAAGGGGHRHAAGFVFDSPPDAWIRPFVRMGTPLAERYGRHRWGVLRAEGQPAWEQLGQVERLDVMQDAVNRANLTACSMSTVFFQIPKGGAK